MPDDMANTILGTSVKRRKNYASQLKIYILLLNKSIPPVPEYHTSFQTLNNIVYEQR